MPGNYVVHPQSKRGRFEESSSSDGESESTGSDSDEESSSMLINYLIQAGVEPRVASLKVKHMIKPDEATNPYRNASVINPFNKKTID